MSKKQAKKKDKKRKMLPVAASGQERRAEPAMPPAMASPMLDRRAMERTMSDIGRLLAEHEFESIDEANAFLQKTLVGGRVPPVAGRTPAERAQDLMYDAFESTDPRRRVQLARQALEVSPDCADAYGLLAEETALSLADAKKLYEEGVKAGERALGPKCFKESVGHFWGVTETRPYMRARASLAECLWRLGEHEAAIGHYGELLRLNPNDNQGLRYILLNCLQAEGKDAEAGKLMGQYKGDPTATWQYGKALHLFRTEGAGATANAALRAALAYNRHVSAYLLGSKTLPTVMPSMIGLGDENEAVVFAAGGAGPWTATPGSLVWLKGMQAIDSPQQLAVRGGSVTVYR